jgi:hypothetical protein
MQARILRIGQALIPAYQKQLPDTDPSKINFRFYAIDDNKTRADIFCNVGLVLIPIQVVARLENDDQVAAVLADGVAYQMQIQSAQLISQNRALFGAELATAMATSFIPGASVGVSVAGGVVAHERNLRMEEQRGRIALGLMADAGNDPHQAPEAWRRLWQKDPPKDTDPVKYPDRSGYLLGILNLQYSPSLANASGSNSRASAGSSP